MGSKKKNKKKTKKQKIKEIKTKEKTDTTQPAINTDLDLMASYCKSDLDLCCFH